MFTILTLLGHSGENFERLYSQLRPMVDRWIVVLDQGMEFNAPGATIVRALLPNGPDFGSLRNQGLAAAQGGWVLHLDSDEWFSRMQLDFLRRFVMPRIDSDVDCIKLPRRNISPEGDWLGWPDMRPCLHQAKLDVFWLGKVEEWPQNVTKIAGVDDDSLAILHLQLDRKARELAHDLRQAVLNS